MRLQCTIHASGCCLVGTCGSAVLFESIKALPTHAPRGARWPDKIALFRGRVEDASRCHFCTAPRARDFFVELE